MKKIWTPKLIETLPENLLSDAKIYATAAAFDLELEKLSAATREVLHIPRLNELSGRILDYLAEQLHIDFYEPLYLNEDEKKNLIRESIAWHRIKGTVGAVEQIAAQAFREAQIEEWFEYDGEPYHFRITSKGWKSTPDGLETFLRMIWAAKNVRSHLDKIIVDHSPKEPVNIFAGIAKTDVGLRTIDIARPRDIRQKIHACGVLYNSGVGLMSLALPRILMGNRHAQTVGQAMIKSGDVIIDAWKGDLPKHNDLIESPITDLLIADVGIAREGEIKIPVEEYDRAYRTGFFIGTGSFIVGSKKLDLQRPRDVKQKFFASVGTGILGSVTIKTKPEIRKRSSFILRAGQSIYRAGSITIDTSTQPSIPDDKRFYGRIDNINTICGNFLMRQGVERIELGTQRWNETYKILKRAGVAMIKSGTLRIETVDDIFDAPNGEWLKLWFSFPTGASKIILLQNPRDDLTKAMIRQLGDFAAADEILINEKGDPTTGISRAALITERTRKIF